MPGLMTRMVETLFHDGMASGRFARSSTSVPGQIIHQRHEASRRVAASNAKRYSWMKRGPMWFWRGEPEVLLVWVWTLVALATSGFFIFAMVKNYLQPRGSHRYSPVPIEHSKRDEEALDRSPRSRHQGSGIEGYPGEVGFLRLVESWKNSPQCPESDQQLLSTVIDVLNKETEENREFSEQA